MAQWRLVSLALSMLMSALGISIVSVALPTLVHDFSASFQDVQWVVIAYLLAITITIVSAGRLGDILGHRRVLLSGIVLFTFASILCALAPTLWLLVAARAVQGLGAAILMALTVALVRDTVPKEKTGSAMGLLGTMSAIGTSLGPSLGGFLLTGLGWRAIFLILMPLGILNFFLAHRYMPAQEASIKKGGKGFDVLGTLLLGLTLAAYVFAVTFGDGHFDRINISLLIAAAIGTCLFVLAEKKAISPLIQLAAFRNASFSSSLAMNVLSSTVIMSTLVVGPFYLTGALGLSEIWVGTVMSIGPIISAFSGVPAGRLVDRFGAPAIVKLGLLAMATGSFALSYLPAFFGIIGYIAAIAILTPGYQMFLAANNTAVMMDVDAEQRGVISGMLSLSRNLGLITGASVMGAVFAFAAKTNNIVSAIPDAVSDGLQTTFTIAGILMLFALAIAILCQFLTENHS